MNYTSTTFQKLLTEYLPSVTTKHQPIPLDAYAAQELRLLQHVLEKAPPGNPHAICEAGVFMGGLGEAQGESPGWSCFFFFFVGWALFVGV